MKVLMVCLGNICRSPLAEGILKAKVRASGLNWEVDSAGTSAWHIGEPPDPRSIQIANSYQIDISDQKARQFQNADFQEFDLILTMDSSNYNNVKALSSSDNHAAKVELILNYVNPGMNMNVPDPYYNDKFADVFQLIEEACKALISKYNK